MAKRHWYTGLSGACKVPRSLLGWWYEISPSAFLDHYAVAPDRICTDCAKAARLALAAESAPKPSDIVWPKPRPISEAPTDGTSVLAHWSVGNFPRLRGCRWEVARVGSGLAWFNEHDEPLSAPDYFLPLPPEVK